MVNLKVDTIIAMHVYSSRSGFYLSLTVVLYVLFVIHTKLTNNVEVHIEDNASASKHGKASAVSLTAMKIELPFSEHSSFPTTLEEACSLASTPQREIVMAIIGTSHHDMFMNFYYTSIAKHNISNVMFISTDSDACEQLKIETKGHVRVTCFVDHEDEDSYTVSRWNSVDYIRKVTYKTVLALRILQLGFKILITDIDEVYLHNPLPHIHKACATAKCDIVAQWNHNNEYNSGFVYVHPTPNSIQMYRRMYDIYNTSGVADQDTMNIAIQEMEKAAGLVVVKLDAVPFPTGPAFFTDNMRCPPSERYDTTVVVHNNFMKHVEDKIQRFKDCKLWEYDGLDGYYSSSTRKYLRYSGLINTHNRSMVMHALFNGLSIARILNRTFILPAVEAHPSVPPHNMIVRLFKNGTPRFYYSFAEITREDCFLEHRLVPATIVNSISPIYCALCLNVTNCPNGSTILKTTNREATDAGILELFAHVESSVLVINPVYITLNRINYAHILGDSAEMLWKRYISRHDIL